MGAGRGGLRDQTEERRVEGMRGYGGSCGGRGRYGAAGKEREGVKRQEGEVRLEYIWRKRPWRGGLESLGCCGRRERKIEESDELQRGVGNGYSSVVTRRHPF